MLRKVVRESRHGELQAEAWYYYGVNLMRLSDPVSALSEFHQWIALFQNHPLEPSIYYHIGLCHNELGEREQALATYRKILSDFHDPGIAGLTQHRLDETLSGYNDGVTIYRFGELERAQREFLRILKEYPDASVTVGSRYFLALIASRESRYQEALRGFTALLRDYPEGPFAAESCFRLLEIYQSLGDQRRSMQMARILESDYTNTYWHREAQKRFFSPSGEM